MEKIKVIKRRRKEWRCPYCHGIINIGDNYVECQYCRAEQHDDCFSSNKSQCSACNKAHGSDVAIGSPVLPARRDKAILWAKTNLPKPVLKFVVFPSVLMLIFSKSILAGVSIVTFMIMAFVLFSMFRME